MKNQKKQRDANWEMNFVQNHTKKKNLRITYTIVWKIKKLN